MLAAESVELAELSRCESRQWIIAIPFLLELYQLISLWCIYGDTFVEASTGYTWSSAVGCQAPSPRAQTLTQSHFIACTDCWKKTLAITAVNLNNNNSLNAFTLPTPACIYSDIGLSGAFCIPIKPDEFRFVMSHLLRHVRCFLGWICGLVSRLLIFYIPFRLLIHW